jgi:alanine racemase
VPDAQVGDEVVIIGRQGDAEITTAEVAKRHGLGLHHVATTVGPRVTRVYLRGGAPVATVAPEP